MDLRTKKQPDHFEESPGEPARVVEHYVNITSVNILKVVGVCGGVFVLWLIRDVIGMVFVALVFASALDPWVDVLSRYRIPRGITILFMYLLFFAICIFAFYSIIPPFVAQLSGIIASVQQYIPQAQQWYGYITQSSDPSLAQEWSKNLTSVNTTLSNITSSVFDAVTGLFGGIATVLLVMVITFYMTIEEEGLKKFIRSIAPIQYQPYLVQKTNRIQTKMGAWLRGQLILMAIIGTFSFIGLAVLGVPYALVLAVIAGVAEFVPFIGPMIAAVPAIFFAYTDSPWKAVAVIIFYFILQQLENQVIVPQVMRKAVGLNPIVVIVVMLIGAKIAGVAGILLAVPAATIAWIFLGDFFKQKKQMDNKLEEHTV